jgi:hypothetical protein
LVPQRPGLTETMTMSGRAGIKRRMSICSTSWGLDQLERDSTASGRA